jgi:malonate-semialdehyde dehydrogenase (acetylating)/methylmalonate-semialdehyde dehydrogenase
MISALAPRVESLKIGPYTAGDDVDFGPLITPEAYTRVKGLVDSGVEQGATLVVDGRDFTMQGYENGNFIGGCLFDNVTPDMEIYKQEIFGPVLTTVRANSYEEAINLAIDHEYGNGTAIYARLRRAHQYRHGRHQRSDPGAAGLPHLRRLEEISLR